jgi:hypothetical protein
MAVTSQPRRLWLHVAALCVTLLVLVLLCATAFAQIPPKLGPKLVPKIDPKILAQQSTILRFPTQIRLDPNSRIPFAVLGDGRRYRLLTPAEVQAGQTLSARVVNLPNQIEARRVGPWVLKSGPPPATFDLLPSQTGIRDQSGRGTCTYHSTTAAMEAAYKRAGAGDLDLSEQFMTWLRDVTLLAEAEIPGAPSQTDATKRECQVGSLSGGGSSQTSCS